MRRLFLLIVLAALVVPAVAAAFANTEPDAAKEWYLDQDEAWSFWPTMPSLAPVKVAIIDSGIDGSHPDLVGRVVAAKSFVGGSAYRDEQGHGTFVAGEIAANPVNGIGMAGLAFNARLIIAKVGAADGDVSLPAEVAAIRWAVDQGARVINLSLGGVRDPLNPSLDTYSPLEREAVEYAYSKGVVVVAAVGNGTQSPSTPWRYAAYPAALPHVIGVSAVRRDGSVPDYSNRDAVYVDVAAPGDDMFSTIPSNLVADDSGCAEPYSDCGPFELRNAIGTSFAAPQVSAAAALLIGTDPSLTPDQVSYLVERSADDSSTLSGCGACASGRDALTGWGTLDVASALARLTSTAPLPRPDRYEPNDDAGIWAHTLPASQHAVDASLDYWDDNLDVYRVRLFAGQRLFVRLTPAAAAQIRVQLWAPGTDHVDGLDLRSVRLADSHQAGGQARLSFRVRTRGVYYLSAKVVSRTPEPVQYHMSLAAIRRSP
ncbi:MAG TPA: S8 family serine peptidase [Gaiellaceae bacterium]|nr:S8 family serine peptidase [Gaiellaceae bacterium]